MNNPYEQNTTRTPVDDIEPLELPNEDLRAAGLKYLQVIRETLWYLEKQDCKKHVLHALMLSFACFEADAGREYARNHGLSHATVSYHKRKLEKIIESL